MVERTGTNDTYRPTPPPMMMSHNQGVLARGARSERAEQGDGKDQPGAPKEPGVARTPMVASESNRPSGQGGRPGHGRFRTARREECMFW